MLLRPAHPCEVSNRRARAKGGTNRASTARLSESHAASYFFNARLLIPCAMSEGASAGASVGASTAGALVRVQGGGQYASDASSSKQWDLTSRSSGCQVGWWWVARDALDG